MAFCVLESGGRLREIVPYMLTFSYSKTRSDQPCYSQNSCIADQETYSTLFQAQTLTNEAGRVVIRRSSEKCKHVYL
jgi:hypothetical protein